MLKSAAALLLAAHAAAADRAPVHHEGLFDGDIARQRAAAPARDWGPLARFSAKDGRSLNFCAPALLSNPGLPRTQLAMDERIICEASEGADPVSGLATLAAPGDDGGGLGGRGIRALLSHLSLESSDFRRRLNDFYGSVAASRTSVSGWAWTLALKAADGNPVLAARLAGFCGHDDLRPGEALQPETAGEARAAFEAATELLKERSSVLSQQPADPLSPTLDNLAANDRLTARDRLAAMASADFSVKRTQICPAPRSTYYMTDALGAGPARARRRVFTGALLACEAIRAGASPAAAESAAANAAWVNRLIWLGREGRELAEGRRVSDGGALGELLPVRADAMILLALWNPEHPFPGPTPPVKPGRWSPARYAAAVSKLNALGSEWTQGVEDYVVGARFGARACANR